MNTSRRVFLASAAAIATPTAGCLGGGSGNSAGSDGGTVSTTGSEPTTGTASPTETTGTEAGSASSGTSTAGSDSESETATTEPTTPAADFEHPATAHLASQPVLGPAPGTVPSIVAFEDPSCPNCKRFNTTTFPELEAKLIDSGKVSYVYRNFPYAFAWGRPAMGALEATYARSETAFWKLKSHYFATQSEFGEGNVLDRTREFLASETRLDAGAVIEAVREGAYERALERDVNAGEAAGVVSTPTFFLFRDGEFLTEIRGAQSYQVFARALGV